MLNSAMFFIFIAMAVSGFMKETTNARIGGQCRNDSAIISTAFIHARVSGMDGIVDTSRPNQKVEPSAHFHEKQKFQKENGKMYLENQKYEEIGAFTTPGNICMSFHKFINYDYDYSYFYFVFEEGASDTTLPLHFDYYYFSTSVSSSSSILFHNWQPIFFSRSKAKPRALLARLKGYQKRKLKRSKSSHSIFHRLLKLVFPKSVVLCLNYYFKCFYVNYGLVLIIMVILLLFDYLMYFLLCILLLELFITLFYRMVLLL